ncbi:MAG: hypothetical protein V4501_12410 [Pseudomonadota bacterium]
MGTPRLTLALDMHKEEATTQKIDIDIIPNDGISTHKEVIVPVVIEPQISKWYSRIGKSIALIFGLGTGITAAAAFLSGGTLIIPALILSSFSAYANYRMTNGNIIVVLEEGVDGLFKKEKSATGAEDDNESPYISQNKQFLLKIGMFLSVTFGATMAALTYVAVLKLAVFTLLAPVAFLLPAFGIVIATVTLISQTVVMTKGFSDIIKVDNLLEKIKSRCWEMFGPDEVRDLGKSKLQIVAERSALALVAGGMLLTTIALVMLGIANTLATCAVGFKDILMSIPNASPAVVSNVSFVITQVFSLVAQIPFVLKVTSTPIVWLFSPGVTKDADQAEPKPLDMFKILDTAFLFIACFLNSACMSAIAMEGKVIDTFTMIGGFGAFLNGFIGSTVNALISEVEEKQVEEETLPPHPHSTLIIHGHLRTAPTLDLVVTESKEEELHHEQVVLKEHDVHLSVTNGQSEDTNLLRRVFK